MSHTWTFSANCDGGGDRRKIGNCCFWSGESTFVQNSRHKGQPHQQFFVWRN